MFGSVLKWLPMDVIWSAFPQMVRPIIDDYIDKDLTQEDRKQIQNYIDMAQKATMIFGWFTDEMENLLQGKPVDLNRVEKLKKWETPESDRKG